MRRIILLGATCCGIAIAGCATRDAAPPLSGARAPLELQTGALLEREDLSADEEAAFNVAFAEMERYLSDRFGKEKLRELNDRIVASSDLYESLKETYDTNPLSLLSELSLRPSLRSREERGDWRTSTSDHFLFQYHAGSPAERDLDVIIREAENALTGACAELGFTLEHLEVKLNSLREARDSASGLYGVKGGELELTGGRIPVILTEDSEEYREFRGDGHSSGVNNFNASGAFDGRLLYSDHLVSYYLDLYQLIVMNHEIVHAVHYVASTADAAVWRDFLQKRMESEGEAATVTVAEFTAMANPVNMDKYVVEGLATWYCARFGLVPRVLKTPTLRRMASDVMGELNDGDLQRVIEWKVSLNVFEKALTVFGAQRYVKGELRRLYIGAGSFIEYIREEHGTQGLHGLMRCTSGNAGERLRSVFGVPVDELDRDWRQWVLDSSDAASRGGPS